MFKLTDRAVTKVRQLAEREGVEKVLRVGVKGGGCAGLTYFMDFDANPRDGDTTLEYDDLRVVCDPKSLPYLEQVELDYETALLKAGFRFNNPTSKQSCSCGESFAP